MGSEWLSLSAGGESPGRGEVRGGCEGGSTGCGGWAQNASRLEA